MQQLEAQVEAALSEARSDVGKLHAALHRARAAGLAAAADGASMTDPMRALLLAREAVRAEATPAAVAALRRALLASNERAAITGDGGGVRALAWTPQGDVVAGRDDGTACRWRPAPGAVAGTLPALDGAVRGVAVSADGSTLALGADGAAGATVVLRLGPDGESVSVGLRGLRGVDVGVTSIVFAPDGNLLATGTVSGAAFVHDRDAERRATLRGHDAAISAVAWSPRGDACVTGSLDATARVWAPDGREVAVLRGHEDAVLAVAWSERTDLIATTSKDGTARLWSPAGDERAVLRGHTDSVTCAAFAPRGSVLATGGEDGTLRLWSADGEALLATVAHAARITSVAWSRDGSRVLTASWDGTSKLHDARGAVLAVFAAHGAWMDAAQFSPDESLVATGARDGAVRVFATLPAEVAALRGHTDAARCVAFAPDGALLSGGEDGSVRVWRGAGFATSSVLASGAEGVLAVSADAAGVVTATARDGAVRRIGPDGTAIAPPTPAAQDAQAPPAMLTATVGDRAADATGDGVVVVRDAAGATVATIPVGASRVSGVALSPDGRKVATAHYDGVVRVWAVDAAELVALADVRVTRDLTPDERDAFADLLPAATGR